MNPPTDKTIEQPSSVDNENLASDPTIKMCEGDHDAAIAKRIYEQQNPAKSWPDLLQRKRRILERHGGDYNSAKPELDHQDKMWQDFYWKKVHQDLLL